MSAAPTFRESAATAEAAQAGLLYERYAGRILGFCRNRLRSQEEAEDAVQLTFLNAYRSLRTGTVPRAEAAWLYKIAENVCRERQRSAWRRSRIEVVSDDGEVGGSEAAPERDHGQLAGLADALAELTPNQRRAILMREWQGLSYREIARELSLTESAVETLLFRARRALAQKLDRSRSRVRGWLDVGSLAAWGKSLLGTGAAKVAAATVVVAAGVAAGTPALRSAVLGEAPAHPVARTAQATARQGGPAAAPAAATAGARPQRTAAISPPAQRADRSAAQPTRDARPAGPRPTTTSGSTPAPPSGMSDPAPASTTAPPSAPVPAPVSVPPPPAVEVPPLPQVELPPLPPVELPPPPPLPTVTVPDLPIVPPLPPVELPKLP